jgi:hypothetical protein
VSTLPPTPPPDAPPAPSLTAALAQFDPRLLLRFCLSHWRHNPLVARLWKKLRPYALGLALLHVIIGSLGVLTTLLSTSAGTAPMIGVGIALLASLVGLGLLLGQVAAPILYADWAYGYTWLRDESLRVSLLSRTERMAGILLPAIAALGCFYLPALLITPLTIILQSLLMEKEVAFMFGVDIPSRLLFLLATTSQQLWSSAVYLMLSATVVLRRLVQRPMPGIKTDKGFGYLAAPYVLTIGVFIVWSIVRGCLVAIIPMTIMLPAIFGAAITGKTPPPGVMPSFDIPWWAGIFSSSLSLVAVIIDFLSLFIVYAAFRSFWKDDLVLARQRLFDVTERPAPPPTYPAPPPVPSP